MICGETVVRATTEGLLRFEAATTQGVLVEKVFAWGGLACLSAFFIALMSVSFILLPPPPFTVDQVAAMYRSNATGIRAGMGFMLVSSMFYVLFVSAISGQIRRIPGVSSTLTFAQLAGGTFACISFLMPAIFFLSPRFGQNDHLS